MYAVQRLAVAVLVAFTFMVAAPLSAGILYSQPYDGHAAFTASQNDTNVGGNGAFATVYDNFTLSGGGSIDTVDWTGGYFNGSPATITAWTVSFYADSAGQPGSLLQAQVTVGNGNETDIGSPTFSYSVALTTPFAAAAGTPYWLSVVPDLGFPPQWGWGTATGGDGIAYQDFFGARTQLDDNFAFSLEGSTVPEPVSMVLVGSALALLALRRRRSA